jgi:hypothetical protein
VAKVDVFGHVKSPAVAGPSGALVMWGLLRFDAVRTYKAVDVALQKVDPVPHPHIGNLVFQTPMPQGEYRYAELFRGFG